MRFVWKIEFISDIIKIWKDDKVIDKKVLCLQENDDEAQFPNTIAFDFLKEKTELLDAFKIGDIVEVMWNSSYNKYNNPAKDWMLSIFNSLRGWKINMVKSVEVQKDLQKEKDYNDELPF